MILDDLLGIADPAVTLPRIDPDARRRRLAALINTANLARTEPILYVMEDVHWIDQGSESMMADILAVIGQTPAMSLITYRPEYEGALTRVHGAQTIALTPLTDSETSSLIGELLGPDPSSRRRGRADSVPGRAEIRSSPRKWCASWPSGVCSTASVAITSVKPTSPM